MKHSEEIELDNKQKQSDNITYKESQCVIYRLKLFAHILIDKKGNNGSPIKSLIELCHKIISENESQLVGNQEDRGRGGPYGYPSHPRYSLGGGGLFPPGYGGMGGDYEHCINALRAL